jgi:hypothetical protein
MLKRSAVRSAVEHVFAGQKHRMGIIVQRIASNDQAQHHLKGGWDQIGIPGRDSSEWRAGSIRNPHKIRIRNFQ